MQIQSLSKEQQRVLGAVTLLCSHSPVHREYTAAMIQHLFIPPILLKQYLLYENSQGPLAFCSWSFLSDKKLYQVQHEQYVISPNDWQSGSQLFFPDFLAPFGHCKRVVKDLRKLFAGRKAHGLRLKTALDKEMIIRKTCYANRASF